MPRTPIASHNLTDAATPGTILAEPALTALDTVNGNSCPNTGLTFLHVKNTDTAQHTVTLITPGTVDGIAVADDPRIIPASSSGKIARLPVAVYGSTLQFTCDSALVSVIVFEP